MVTTLKDESGKVISYVEWRLVGRSGFDKVNGEYVYIYDFWVHPDYRHKGRIAMMTDEVMKIVPDSAKHCYFKRDKYMGRIKMFSRKFWERRRRAEQPIQKES